MIKKIKKYVLTCFNCVKNKTFKHKFYELLQFLSIFEKSRQN